MRFFSDNAAAVCPEVMQAIVEANHLDTAYDGDALSKRLNGAFSDLFGTACTAMWVATGTAANGLALAALCPPHGSVLCHRDAHIQNDECGAPEFYTHEAKLVLLEGQGARLTPDAVTAALDAATMGGALWARLEQRAAAIAVCEDAEEQQVNLGAPAVLGRDPARVANI